MDILNEGLFVHLAPISGFASNVEMFGGVETSSQLFGEPIE